MKFPDIFNKRVIKELKEDLDHTKESFNRYRDETSGWTSMSDVEGSISDFSTENRENMQEKAKEAFFFSPAGKRMVRYATSYVMGRGFEISSSNESVNFIINEFIKNPKNKWKTQVKEWQNRLQTGGEIFATFFTGDDGSVLVRETDPFEIKEILTNPDDITEPILYKREFQKLTYASGEAQKEDAVEYIRHIGATEADILLLNLDIEQAASIAKTEKKFIYHVKTLTYTNRKRGLSDFSAILYYLSRLRKDVDNRSKLNQLKEAFFIDVCVDGTGDDVAQEAAKTQYKKPPKAGSTFFHNKKIEIGLKQPNLDNADANKSLEPLLQQIVIGSGMPEWMLVGQANMFKAGATEQSAPFIKLIEDYQEQWEQALTDMLTFVIWTRLNANPDRKDLAETRGIKGILGQIDNDGLVEAQVIDEKTGRLVPKKIGGELVKIPFRDTLNISFPEIITRDENKEADAVTKDLANGLVSKQTASNKRNYNYEDEKVLIAIEKEEEMKNNPLMIGDDHENEEPADEEENGEES